MTEKEHRATPMTDAVKHTRKWGYYRLFGETASQPQQRFVPLGIEFVEDKQGWGFAFEEDARLIAAAPELLAARKANDERAAQAALAAMAERAAPQIATAALTPPETQAAA